MSILLAILLTFLLDQYWRPYAKLHESIVSLYDATGGGPTVSGYLHLLYVVVVLSVTFSTLVTFISRDELPIHFWYLTVIFGAVYAVAMVIDRYRRLV